MKAFLFWLVVLISGVLLWTVVRNPKPDLPEIAYSDLLREAESDKIAEVEIAGDRLSGKRRDGSAFWVTIPADPVPTVEALRKKNVTIRFKAGSEGSTWLQTLLTMLPMLLLLGLWFFMIRQQQSMQQRRPPGEQQKGWWRS